MDFIYLSQPDCISRTITKFARCGSNTEKNNVHNGINNDNSDDNNITGISFSVIKKVGGLNLTGELGLAIFWL